MGKLLLSALTVAALAGCDPQSSGTSASTAQERADRYYHNIAETIEEKESVAEAPTAHVLVDTAVAPNGTMVTLWLTDPAVTEIRSRCDYLDQAHPDGSSTGAGGCGEPTDRLSLNGNADLLVGTIDSPATWVRVSAGPDRLSVPMLGGYFLVPPKLTHGRDDVLTFTLLSAEGTELGTFTADNKPGISA